MGPRSLKRTVMTIDPAARAGAILEIDLGGIVANWRLLARKAAPAQCAAVVKANAYGLGAAPVARALAAAGCRMFFVATLDEGIALRAALGEMPEIAILNGPAPRHRAQSSSADRLIPVLNEPGQIADWRKAGRGAPRHAACRYRHDAARPHGARIHRSGGDHQPPIRWRALMSHLACADRPGHAMNGRQLAQFAAAWRGCRGCRRCRDSEPGGFLGHFPRAGLSFRPGPSGRRALRRQPAARPRPIRCAQSLRLSGKILQVRDIDRGETVGYGAAHVMDGTRPRSRPWRSAMPMAGCAR